MSIKPVVMERAKRRASKPSETTPIAAKQTLESASLAFGVLTKGSMFFGFVALSLYLGSTEHLVVGVNAMEGLLLGSLTLALGFIGTAFVIMGSALFLAPINVLVKIAATGKRKDDLGRVEKTVLWAFWGLVLLLTVVVPVFSEHFMASELTTARVWQWLGFGVFSGLLLGSLWARVLPLYGASASDRTTATDAAAEGLMLAITIVASYAICLPLGLFLSPTSLTVTAVAGSMLAVGFSVATAKGPRVTPGWRAAGLRCIAISIILGIPAAILLRITGADSGIAMAFRAVNLYAPHATVELSAANMKLLDRLAAREGRGLDACRAADGSGTLSDVRVLWHGVGTFGRLELWPESIDIENGKQKTDWRALVSPYEQWFQVMGRRGVRVPVPNDGMRVMTGTNRRCTELSGTHFSPDSARLDPAALASLTRQLDVLWLNLGGVDNAKASSTIERVEVVGHADSTPRRSGTNEELARARAETVGDVVTKWLRAKHPDWRTDHLSIRSEGARENVRECSAGLPAEREACNAFNRRVQLQLTLAPKARLPKGS